MFVAALLFGAGCRDMTMDLLPPPPSASAGTGGDGAGGMAGETGMGDAAEGGTGGTGETGGTRGGGGFGGTGPTNGGSGYGGSSACGPGTNCPPPCQSGPCPCSKHSDCPAGLGLPFCQYGSCVACLTKDCEPGKCGCEPEETCADIVNYCVPRCSGDDPCTTDERPYCVRNTCVECVGDKDCESNDRRKHCLLGTGTCFECTTSEDCKDDDAPVCTYEFTCARCWTDFDCGEGRVCREGRCLERPLPPDQQPQPEP
jgi:hypothetical protein